MKPSIYIMNPSFWCSPQDCSFIQVTKWLQCSSPQNCSDPEENLMSKWFKDAGLKLGEAKNACAAQLQKAQRGHHEVHDLEDPIRWFAPADANQLVIQSGFQIVMGVAFFGIYALCFGCLLTPTSCGYPSSLDGWCPWENPVYTWMMTGGSLLSGNLHMYILYVCI